MAKCYLCDNESVSREHTPAQSFFPTGHRNNLVTVPSCTIHNENTSSDDEYVRNIVTTSINNNQTSINHFFDKSFRSFQRHPGLINPILSSLKDVSCHELNAKAFQIDRSRFDRIMRKVAYALFFHEFKITWDRSLAVTTNQLKMSDMTNDHLGKMFEELSKDLSSLILKGNNPLVFQYSFFKFGDDEFDQALFMIFYEGFPLWIIPDKTSNRADLS